MRGADLLATERLKGTEANESGEVVTEFHP